METRKTFATAALIVNILFITDLVVTQTLPRNAAARVGDEVVFNCSSSGQIPLWQYSRNGFNMFVYISAAGNCKLLNSSLTNYKVESTTALGCNLIVIKATDSDAGVYICDDTQGQKILAMLTVIDNVQVFPTNDELGPVVENELINMTCSVQHTAPSIPAPQMFPSIVWTNLSANANITGDESSTSSLVTSNITVIAIRPNISSYSCIVYFKEPNPTVDYAMNAPYYTSTTMTQKLIVQYNGPSKVTETPYNESDFCNAKILECTPDAYPSAIDMYWLDVLRNDTINGTEITGEYGGEYNCIVINMINGETNEDNTTYSLHDINTFTLPTCQGVTSSQIKVTVLGKDCNLENDIVVCENVTEVTEVTISCNDTDALPTATVSWQGPCITLSNIQHPEVIIVKASGSYSCIAKNSINGRPFEESITIEVTGLPLPDDTIECAEYKQTKNCAKYMCEGMCIEDWLCILLLVIVPWFGLNLLLFLCAFLPCYCCSKSYKRKINDRFHWIEKAWPCMNERGCGCSWELTMFIFASVFAGVIFIPYVLIASACCQGTSKRSQGDDVDLDERDRNTENNHQSERRPPPKTSSSTGRPPNSQTQNRVDHSHDSQNRQSYNQSRPHPNHGMASSPSPVNADGVVYQELRIDANPRSRKPIEMINAGQESAYAPLGNT